MNNDPLPTRDEIEQSQRICEAATKGPWYAVLFADTYMLQVGPDYSDPGLDGPDPEEEGEQAEARTRQGKINMEFCTHSRTALPRANAALLRFMDLLPYVQHMPGCTADLREMKEMDTSGSRFQVTGIKKCNCNLTERLAALGLGERGEGGGG